MLSKPQGSCADKLFHGISNNKNVDLFYGESADLFCKIIKDNFMEGDYSLLDIGSHKGELLKDLILRLDGYNLVTTAVDVNESDLKVNPADIKILSDAQNILIKNDGFDISICRYVLAWNSLDNQRKIVDEIKRLTKGLAIIQHQGEESNSFLLQDASKILFDGRILSLKREEFYFSKEEELEKIFNDLNIKYNKVQSRKIYDLSDLFIEKYHLNDNDAKNVKSILSNSDYVNQSTYVLDFRK